ncbi:hypothetical protein SDC9_108603 [bioreactor metagenome]|uniref:Uncharacterized protein n=1 Tax=bioreactor metagenome TaxID=1076179 RepID=A0A645BEZ1_9ZZZZ
MEGLLPVKIGAVQQLPDRLEGEAAGAEQQNLLQAIHLALPVHPVIVVGVTRGAQQLDAVIMVQCAHTHPADLRQFVDVHARSPPFQGYCKA